MDTLPPSRRLPQSCASSFNGVAIYMESFWAGGKVFSMAFPAAGEVAPFPTDRDLSGNCETGALFI